MKDEFENALSDALGWDGKDMSRSRPYAGQPHTNTGERGKAEISGITFRDLRDCFIRAVCLSSGPGELYSEASKGDDAQLSENDVYKAEGLDLMAVCQNLCCEVERIMGTYPNVPKLTTLDDIEIIGEIDEDGKFRRR